MSIVSNMWKTKPSGNWISECNAISCNPKLQSHPLGLSPFQDAGSQSEGLQCSNSSTKRESPWKPISFAILLPSPLRTDRRTKNALNATKPAEHSLRTAFLGDVAHIAEPSSKVLYIKLPVVEVDAESWMFGIMVNLDEFDGVTSHLLIWQSCLECHHDSQTQKHRKVWTTIISHKYIIWYERHDTGDARASRHQIKSSETSSLSFWSWRKYISYKYYKHIQIIPIYIYIQSTVIETKVSPTTGISCLLGDQSSIAKRCCIMMLPMWRGCSLESV